MNYQGVVLLGGNLCIPYVVLQTFPEGLGQEQVEVGYDEPFELPGELAKYRERIIEEKKKKAKQEGRTFFDGPLVRLRDYFPNEDEQHLELVFQRTNFFTYAASNKSLEEPIEELGGKTVREHYSPDPKEPDNVLANPIGINTVLLTKDKRVILVERSKKLSQYPGLYGVPAGFMKPEDTTPFETARRETREEVGKFNIQVRLYELGRALDDLHIEIGMVGQIDADKGQIEEAVRTSEWEAKKRLIVPFNPRDCGKYMVMRITEIPPNVPQSAWVIGKSPAWVPAHHRILYLALVKEYGQEEVSKELKKLL